jgi:hypothetical protein
MLSSPRVKGSLIAIVVLALSAGVVFGADALPTAAESGLDRAAEASGKDVPVGRQSDPDADLDEGDGEDGDDGELVVEEPLAEEAADEALEESWDNHGAMVSEAAHMDTPEGFRNHGHWVSCVAHMDSAEWVDLTTLTPEDCEGDEATEEEALETSWDNHGAMVSEAAHMDAPEGFRNHGHFVSCVAHMDESESVELATLTAEDCSDAEAGAATDEDADEDAEATSDADKGNNKDKAKGQGKAKDQNRGKGRGHNR